MTDTAPERGRTQSLSEAEQEFVRAAMAKVGQDLIEALWELPGFEHTKGNSVVEDVLDLARRLRARQREEGDGGLLSERSLLVTNSQSPREGHRCAVHVNPVEEDWGPRKLTEPVAVAWADDPGVATAVALRRADEKLRATSREGEREPVAWRWRFKGSSMGWIYWPEEPTDIAEPHDWDIQPLYTQPGAWSERLAGALAAALASAELVRRRGNEPDWWRCSACWSTGRGPGEIEHEPDCPEAVYEAWKADTESLADTEEWEEQA